MAAVNREQRALVLAGVAVAFTILGGFLMSWFHLATPDGTATATIGLSGQEICVDSVCHHAGLNSTGFYGDNAAMTLWGSVAFTLFACAQVLLRLLRGMPSAKWTKKGYFWGVTMAGTVLTTAYLFPPDAAGKLLHATTERTWAPLILAIAQFAAIFVVYYSADAPHDDDVGEYKPIVIAKVAGVPPKKG
jgi:hypothetical protein